MPLAPTPMNDLVLMNSVQPARFVPAAPPPAVLPEKQLVRGAERWYVYVDNGIPMFFAEDSILRHLYSLPGL